MITPPHLFESFRSSEFLPILKSPFSPYLSIRNLPSLYTISSNILTKVGFSHRILVQTKFHSSIKTEFDMSSGMGIRKKFDGDQNQSKNWVRPKCREKAKKNLTLIQTHNKWRKKSNIIPGKREKTKKSYFRTKFVFKKKTMIFKSKMCS